MTSEFPTWSLWLSTAALLAAPWPAWRMVSLSYVRTWRRREWWIACAGLLLWVGMTVLLAVRAPVVLIAAGIAGIALALFCAVRGHSSYGHRKDLPPGSLSLAPQGPWGNPRFFLDQSAAFGPVFKHSHFLRPCANLVGIQRGRSLLAAESQALSVPELPFSRLIPKGFIRFMGTEDHAQYRGLIRTGLEVSLAANAEAVARIVKKHVAEAGQAGRVDPHALGREIAFDTVQLVVFGLKAGTALSRDIRALYDGLRIAETGAVSCATEQRTAAAIADLAQGLSSDSSSVHRALTEAGAPPEGDPTLALNLVYMARLGWNDLSGLLSWCATLVAHQPGCLDPLRTAPDTTARQAAAARVVREVLRLEQSEYLIRETRDEIRFDGFRIPKGWLVRLCIRESHRDPDAFPEPDRFDPERWVEAPDPHPAYMPLGPPGRSCLGAPLLHLVCETFALALARCDVSIETAARREFSGHHWRPGAATRIRLASRSLAQPSPVASPHEH